MDIARTDHVLNWIGRRGTSMITLLAGLLSAALLTYGGYALYDTMFIEKSAEAPLQYKPEIIEDNGTPFAGFGSLQGINPDVGAWLTVYDTKIDYPVAQGKDDLEYINKNAYGEYALSGSIYLSSANASDYSDSYSLLYGHHMDSGAMFGELEHYMEDAYFEAHPEGVLTTSSAVYDMNIFACLETDAYDSAVYGIQAVNSGDNGYAGLEEYILENASQYNPLAEDTGKILAMSTCAGAATNGRTVVFAYLTERAASESAVTLAPAGTSASDPASVSVQTEESAESEEIMDADIPLAEAVNTHESREDNGAVLNLLSMKSVEEITDSATPLANHFNPRGGLGNNCWALLNLICVLLTIYIFLPLHELRSKYGRSCLMRKLNRQHREMLESNPSAGAKMNAAEDKTGKKLYQVKRFTVKFWIGVVLECLISLVVLFWFIHTEDMSLPMVIIDKWTLVMILGLACCWLADLLLVRYRKMKKAENACKA